MILHCEIDDNAYTPPGYEPLFDRYWKARRRAQWLAGFLVLSIGIGIVGWVRDVRPVAMPAGGIGEYTISQAMYDVAVEELKTRLAECEEHASHLGNVLTAERQNLRSCWAAKFEEFAGPESQRHQGGGGLAPSGAGPAKRLEAK